MGGGNALDTLGHTEDGDAVGAVVRACAVGLDALALGVGVESWEAVADLVSACVVAQQSVVCGTAISASVGSQGASIAAGGAG